jgi:hypothetical protein
MKTQKPTQAKNTRRVSEAIIAKRYLEVQELRDVVRKAEIDCGVRILGLKELTRTARQSH